LIFFNILGLQSYEKKILKEKETLEYNIRTYNHNRLILEKRSLEVESNFCKIEKEWKKINLEKELIEYNKQRFFDFNSIINNVSNFDLKLEKVNKLISCINSSKKIDNFDNFDNFDIYIK